mgnify:CR=1 FL=1
MKTPKRGNNQSFKRLFLFASESIALGYELFSFFTFSVLGCFCWEHFLNERSHCIPYNFIIRHLTRYKDENDGALFFVCNQLIFQFHFLKSPGFSHEPLDSVSIHSSLEIPLAHSHHDLRGYGLAQRRVKVAHNDWRSFEFKPGCKDEFWNLFGFQSLTSGKRRGACWGQGRIYLPWM